MNMHIIKIRAILLAGILFYNYQSVQAGNKDRTGQAGATELLINPWARSSGIASAGVAAVRGIEAQAINVAGLAFTQKTEIVFARTAWLVGTGSNLNAFGLSQKIGSSSVLGLGFTSMGFGEIMRTNPDNPEGGLGTFSPRFLNINISYAKEFSNSIYGGINLKVINQSISNLSATGVAIDAGVQYVTGKRKELKFGISLRNIGTPIKYSGDGLSSRATMPIGTSLTIEQRSARFELPSQLNIGGAYDIYFSKENTDHRITAMANFQSNSFYRDIYQLGGEYAFKNMFMARLGYNFESQLFSEVNRTNALTGFCAGATIEVPVNKKGSVMGIDYSFRASNPFSGSHAIGLRLGL
jgi:hypothetical protein